MCGALKLSGIVRANFRLNIAIAMLFFGPYLSVTPLLSCRATQCVATNSHHFRDVAGMSRCIPHSPPRRHPVAPILASPCHCIAGTIPLPKRIALHGGVADTAAATLAPIALHCTTKNQLCEVEMQSRQPETVIMQNLSLPRSQHLLRISGSTPTPWSGPFRDHGLRPWSQTPSEHRKP